MLRMKLLVLVGVLKILGIGKIDDVKVFEKGWFFFKVFQVKCFLLDVGWSSGDEFKKFFFSSFRIFIVNVNSFGFKKQSGFVVGLVMIIVSGVIVISRLVILGKILKLFVFISWFVGWKLSMDGVQNQDDGYLVFSFWINFQYWSLLRFSKFISWNGVGNRFSISSIDFNISSKFVGLLVFKLREFFKIVLGNFLLGLVN